MKDAENVAGPEINYIQCIKGAIYAAGQAKKIKKKMTWQPHRTEEEIKNDILVCCQSIDFWISEERKLKLKIIWTKKRLELLKILNKKDKAAELIKIVDAIHNIAVITKNLTNRLENERLRLVKFVEELENLNE